jgi:hypothetical protein
VETGAREGLYEDFLVKGKFPHALFRVASCIPSIAGLLTYADTKTAELIRSVQIDGLSHIVAFDKPLA